MSIFVNLVHYSRDVQLNHGVGKRHMVILRQGSIQEGKAKKFDFNKSNPSDGRVHVKWCFKPRLRQPNERQS